MYDEVLETNSNGNEEETKLLNMSNVMVKLSKLEIPKNDYIKELS